MPGRQTTKAGMAVHIRDNKLTPPSFVRDVQESGETRVFRMLPTTDSSHMTNILKSFGRPRFDDTDVNILSADGLVAVNGNRIRAGVQRPLRFRSDVKLGIVHQKAALF